VTPPHPNRVEPRAVLLLSLLLSWACNAIVLAIVAWTFTTVDAGTTGQLLAAAAVFGVLNTILKPILRLLTLPLAVLTLGVAWFGVSMLMLWITDELISGFDIHGFWAYVWATVAVWLVNLALELLIMLWLRPTQSGRAVTAG
jgi:putative membrane protein